MALPELTDEQRRAALDKAARARTERALIKNRLRTGGTTLREVFELADSDDVVAKLKVLDLLQALPGVGRVTAVAMMEQHKIAASRRVRGLGPRQRAALIEEFAKRG